MAVTGGRYPAVGFLPPQAHQAGAFAPITAIHIQGITPSVRRLAAMRPPPQGGGLKSKLLRSGCLWAPHLLHNDSAAKTKSGRTVHSYKSNRPTMICLHFQQSSPLATFSFPCKHPHLGANLVKNPFFSQNPFPKCHLFSSIGAGQKTLKSALLCHFLWFSCKSPLPFLTHNRLFFLHFLWENHRFLSKILKNIGFSSSPFSGPKSTKNRMLSCAPAKANTPAYLAAFSFPCKSPHFGANFVKNSFFSQNPFPKCHFFSAVGAGQKC